MNLDKKCNVELLMCYFFAIVIADNCQFVNHKIYA